MVKDNRPEMSPEARKEFYRRQRGKNLAMLGALVAFVLVIYVVAIVRMSGS